MEIATLPGRITDFVDTSGECWRWLKSHGKGDGDRPQTWIDGHTALVYRVLYEHLIGPIPEGLTLDHVVCQNGRCCNPHHCEPVPNGTNVSRALKIRWGGRDACPKGHAHAQWRRYRKSGKYAGDPYCVACGNERSTAWRKKNKK